jgi:hypothetical protein
VFDRLCRALAVLAPPSLAAQAAREQEVRVGDLIAMSRGRDTNQAYIYTRDAAEADHDHGDPIVSDEIHQLRRGTKYSEAQYLRSIVANEGRSRSLHVEAQQTEGELLPDAVRELLDCHNQRLASREHAWREHAAADRDFHAAYERIASSARPSADRGRYGHLTRGRSTAWSLNCQCSSPNWERVATEGQPYSSRMHPINSPLATKASRR